MNRFIFDSYIYDDATKQAVFSYSFEDGRSFSERVEFTRSGDYNKQALDRALFLAFILIGTSYYKTFPSTEVLIKKGELDEYQVSFFNTVFQEGLSQFAYENNLSIDDLAHFSSASKDQSDPVDYSGNGSIVLQSGGKDSLLVATLLAEKKESFIPWYLSSSASHPHVLDELTVPLVSAKRIIDNSALHQAAMEDGKNGHVPITYIVMSIALIQAILLRKQRVLVSIAHEGEEPHAHIGDLPVTHQWSKTWAAEELFADYVTRYISPTIEVGSPLRRYSELRVAELFVTHAWDKFGHRFSSCNVANYKQGVQNEELHWCGECPKCANSYLLFAPFVEANELKSLFGGQDLFEKPLLTETFKGLLGIDGVMKPFECVGEINELRYAYRLAQAKAGYGRLPFDVPSAEFDFRKEYPSQKTLQI